MDLTTMNKQTIAIVIAIGGIIAIKMMGLEFWSGKGLIIGLVTAGISFYLLYLHQKESTEVPT